MILIIRQADKVIFPGVGEASTTMQYLKERKLDQLIAGLKTARAGYLPGTAADVPAFRRRRYNLHWYF